MKKVVTVGIGGTSFVIDEDAYQKLEKYLSRFREKTGLGSETGDVMDDLEQRIAELFAESLGNKGEVVNIALVNKVISQLGMPDGTPADDSFETGGYTAPEPAGFPVSKRLYRNPDDKMIGGVCSGLALYLNLDTTLIRILFVVALFMGSMGFWAYIVFWIAAPVAYTAAQKCEMRGIPVTAENMKKFSMYK
jgi:phage shock protein PspC (stress-responsive transcriptional regulator)